MIAMILWAWWFAKDLLFFAGIVLLGVMLLLNLIFQIYFSCGFNTTVTPKEKKRLYKQGKISKIELNQYIMPRDESFAKYLKKHSCCSCFIAFSTILCTFKCNKAYYSRFYSFGIFKAHWSQGRYYRRTIMCFSIFSMILDALIIFVCVAFLLTMSIFSNMLWITVVEVAVLSLFLIIFGLIEMCRLRTYLAYNEQALERKWGVTSSK